jgi:hypothetical protein
VLVHSGLAATAAEGAHVVWRCGYGTSPQVREKNEQGFEVLTVDESGRRRGGHGWTSKSNSSRWWCPVAARMESGGAKLRAT